MRTPRDVRGLVRRRRALAARGTACTAPRCVGRSPSPPRHHTIRQAGAILGSRADRMPRAAAPAPLARGPRLVRARRRARPARCCRRRHERRRRAVEGEPRLGVGVRPHAPTRCARSRSSRTPAATRRPDDARLGRPAVEGRLGRAHDDLPADPPARAARAPLRDLRLRPVRPRAAAGARAARGDPRAASSRSRRRCSRASTTDSAPTSAIATNWWTAWPLRDLPGCREKAYLVQDDEPQFYATSARVASGPPRRTGWATAASPTRRGWPDCSRATTAWRRAGSSAAPTSTRTRSGTRPREPGLIAVYARRETERRAVDLALAGHRDAVRAPARRPRRSLFGSNAKPSCPGARRRTSACGRRPSSRRSTGARARASSSR